LDLREKDKTASREASKCLLFIEYYYGDEINEADMGGACSTHEIDEKYMQKKPWMGE
jgi:hypothetical protein